MFEEYLEDAYEFFAMAQNAIAVNDEHLAKRYYRAAVFCSASAMEAFLNYIADSFNKSKSLEQHMLAFINDKSLNFAPKTGELVEKSEFHRLDEKLKVIIHKFDPTYDFNNAAWGNFMQFKDFRDELIHPRASEDENSPSKYESSLRKGMSGNIELMNQISNMLFKKPLRKHLLDYLPD